MFTIADVLSAKPPGSPIGTDPYWQGLLDMAVNRVRAICRRQLAEDTYTDVGYTVWDGSIAGGKYVWWLREPTGETLDLSDFSELTLNGATVSSDDVVITRTALLFSTPGLVRATYPGGYCRNETHRAVILQAVVAAMHILHAQMQAAGVSSLPSGFGATGVLHGEQGYETVRAMLAPYIAPLDCR